MFPSRGEKIISFLRWPSLILVTCLLGLFLYRSFKTEKERLNQEVGLLFVNAVKGLEGNMINDLILDSLKPSVFFRSEIKHSDSIKVIALNSNEAANLPRQVLLNGLPKPPHDGLKLIMNKDVDFIQRDNPSNGLTHSKGVISIIMKKNGDTSSRRQTTFTYKFNTDTLIGQKIIKSFDDNLMKAGIHLAYTFHQLKNNDTTNNFHIASATGMYHDIASGENYFVNLKSPNLSVLKTLWPEMLLSVLLISCLSIAFFSMSRTITQERALLTAKNDFIQNMTHELKTPIATVKIALEGLHEYDGLQDIDKRDEYLKISQSEVERLSLLVDRVLSISKLDKELPPAIKESIDLTELIAQVADTCKVQALKQNAIVQVHVQDQDMKVYADRQWLTGILFNLIENAIKYADKDHTQIDLYAQKSEQDIEIKIKDNGPGIALEHQSRIFEKFYRIPQGNVHTIKGHGLGLAFVKKLIDEMGGNITVSSALGQGSEFNISIPA